MSQNTDTASFALLAEEAGFDPIEERLRTNVRATIAAVFEEELERNPTGAKRGSDKLRVKTNAWSGRLDSIGSVSALVERI
jgi:hypothetical protein